MTHGDGQVRLLQIFHTYKEVLSELETQSHVVTSTESDVRAFTDRQNDLLDECDRLLRRAAAASATSLPAAVLKMDLLALEMTGDEVSGAWGDLFGSLDRDLRALCNAADLHQRPIGMDRLI